MEPGKKTEQNKKLTILGATGSIGQNCLDVVSRLPQQFSVNGLSTHTQVEKLLDDTATFKPRMVAITGTEPDAEQRCRLKAHGVELFCGPSALTDLAEQSDYDLLVNAIVGAAGFVPTYRALKRGKDVALANKETLVIGGEHIMAEAKKQQAAILPIDSEHSAIFQCLFGEEPNSVEQLILTASGGPFRQTRAEQFSEITVEQALKHPNWSMGKKITIDSATMMNKGLEIIEARWLFQIAADRIKVAIHPQSIIHSMVLFCDGSIKAQMGLPDMRIPIQLALSFPQRLPATYSRLDVASLQELTFEEPDLKKFPCLDLAYEAVSRAGNAPAVLNGANEAAVDLFLNRKINFDQIPVLIDKALKTIDYQAGPGIDDLLQSDKAARRLVCRAVN
jgi:1-deoxy-D-xylulose-5-phosphate reductoisomerase